MAKRRMFSKEVVCTDDFISLSAIAQAIYFQMGMSADDDGFVSNPKMIARSFYAGKKFMQELITRGYLIDFQTGVIVVTHWNISNSIQKDRYSPTKFAAEMQRLAVENGIYTSEPT